MNVFRSIYSNKEQEEVCFACSDCVMSNSHDEAKSGAGHQAAIKGLIGSTAGVEPEVLLRMMDEIESLRKLFNETQPEVEKATRSLEELISRQFSQTKNSLGGNNDESEGDLDSNSNSFLNDTVGEEESKNHAISSRISKTIQEDSWILASSDGKCDYIDEVESLRSIKSKIETLVEQEIQRVKSKKELIQSEFKKQENNFSDYVDCLVVNSNDDSGDEMSVEESRLFLEAFKVDKERTAGNAFSSKGNDFIGYTESYGCQETMGLYTIEENTESDSLDVASELTPRIYFTPKEANVSSDISELASLNDKDVTSCSNVDSQLTDQKTLPDVASIWWSTDEALASDVLEKLKKAVDCFNEQCATVESKSTDDNLEDMSTEANVTGFELSIEQVATVLANISEKIDSLFSSKQDENSLDLGYTKVKLFNIAKVFFGQLEYPVGDLYSTAVKDENEMMSAIMEMSETFSVVSKRLNNVSPDLKQKPMSIFDPPPSFTMALAFLISIEYFENCFTTGLEQGNRNKFETSICLPDMEDVEQFNSDTVISDEIKIESPHKTSDHSTNHNVSQTMNMEKSLKFPRRRSFLKDSQNLGNGNLHSNDCELYFGFLLPSVMTVENFSHLLLLVSSVLNDVPCELKSMNFLALGPPANLLQGLGILYTADDIDGTINEKGRKSFESLTLQEVSDFTLTLSKVFYDAPPVVKKSSIIDLDSPRALISVLTCLAPLLYDTAVESQSQGEVQVQDWLPTSQSQDKFFDAIDSVTCLNDTP